MQPKILTCAGYYSTGSSVVIDFASEYSSVISLGNEEFRFLHDPDGVDDLEFHLVENHNRHNSGHAIKQYLKMAKRLDGGLFKKEYGRFFNNKWLDITNSYIDSLIDFKFNGWWHYDLYNLNSLSYFLKRLPNKILHMTFWRNHPDRVFNLMKNEIAYCGSPTEQEFIQATKQYIEKLFNEVQGKSNCSIAVDQIVPPSNLERYTKYFDDIKIAIVDRDPRDIYTLEKLYWRSGIIPSESVEKYVQWFNYTRAHRKKEPFNPSNSRFYYFEDFIYRYDETIKDLQEFYELNPEDHINKKQFLNPDKSIKNTRRWLRHPELAKDIAFIENELSEYLYDYSSFNLKEA